MNDTDSDSDDIQRIRRLRIIDGPSDVGSSVRSSVIGSQVHKIIVGVDFGTTFTGVSWVSTEDSHIKTLDHIHCIRDWPGPGREADYSWKTPSRLAYANENGLQANAWGFEVTPRMKSYSWMKLLLDTRQAKRYNDSSLAESEGVGVLRKPSDKSAVDICADFLCEIATFAYESLKKRISVETLAATPLEFWFTVPAVWSDSAKADTFLAAQMAAGQARATFHRDTQLFLIREPEAAAIATLMSMSEDGSHKNIKSGEGVLICDCGGGTVDITTYEISSISPRLEFKELLVGTGGKCGSTYIDREFIRWMERKFGSAFTKLGWEKKGPASRFMKDFEGYKRDFKVSHDPSLYYDLTLFMKDATESKYYDEDSGIVKMYNDDLRSCFEPVVDEIMKLLQSQLDAERAQKGYSTIKTMLLVGGFGDSAYLNDVVRSWCQKHGIRLMCPEHPQAAIVRGAALSGLLKIQPTTRRSRMNYGFSGSDVFDSTIHREKDKYTSTWSGLTKASGNMDWRLRKGAVVDKNTKITHEQSRTVWEDEISRDTTSKVYCCDEDNPPLFEHEESVRKLAVCRVNFKDVDLTEVPRRKKGSRWMRRMRYTWHVTFGERRGVLCFSCICHGQEVGNTTVQFDGQSTIAGAQLPQNCAVQ